MENTYLEPIKAIVASEKIFDYKVEYSTDEFKGDNYMGTMVRIKVTGKNNHNEEVVKDFIVKAATSNSVIRENVDIQSFYRREVFTYGEIFPEFEKLQDEFNIPICLRYPFVKCYYESLEVNKEFLFMNDVGKEGFTCRPRKEVLDFNHIKITLKHLARFHASSFALRKLKPEVYQKLGKKVEQSMGFSQNLCTFVDDVLSNATKYICDDELRERFGRATSYRRTLELCAPSLCEPYNVFCHGDFWISNILYKYQNGNPIDVRFVDWQLTMHASPVIDATRFIFSVTEKEDRDAHYEEFLSIYYSSLCDYLRLMGCEARELYPETVFRQQLRDILIYSLVGSTIALTFALREDEDIEDLEISVGNLVKDTEYNFEFRNSTSAGHFSRRIQGVVEDFVRLGNL